MEAFVCVDKHQKEIDIGHADWQEIYADSRNKAKYKYSKSAFTQYIDVICTAKKNFKKITLL